MNFEEFQKEFNEKFPPLSKEEQQRLNNKWIQDYKERQESLFKMSPLERFIENFSNQGHYPDCMCMCGPWGECDCSFEKDVAAIKILN